MNSNYSVATKSIHGIKIYTMQKIGRIEKIKQH